MIMGHVTVHNHRDSHEAASYRDTFLLSTKGGHVRKVTTRRSPADNETFLDVAS